MLLQLLNCKATLALRLYQTLNHVHSFLRKEWITYLASILTRKAVSTLNYAFVLVGRVVIVRERRNAAHNFVSQQTKKVKINTLIVRSVHQRLWYLIGYSTT